MYLNAKLERRRTELYAMDMIWLLARTKYDIATPSPSHVEKGITQADSRTSQEILAEIKKKTQELINGSV